MGDPIDGFDEEALRLAFTEWYDKGEWKKHPAQTEPRPWEPARVFAEWQWRRSQEKLEKETDEWEDAVNNLTEKSTQQLEKALDRIDRLRTSLLRIDSLSAEHKGTIVTSTLEEDDLAEIRDLRKL